MSAGLHVGVAPDGTAFEVAGPHNGPVALLIHGLGLSRRIFDETVPRFIAAGWRTVTYDLFGHGGSGPAPEPASLAMFARQIVGLLDHLEVETAAVVGFSIGGMINRRLARDAGDRASSLVIWNSPHDRGPDAQAQVEARAKQVVDEGAMATMDGALVRWFTPGHLDARPDHEALVRGWRADVHLESYAGAAWVLANGVVELTVDEPVVTHPTLVMTSEHDTGSTPPMARAIAAQIPEAETLIVPGLQHLGLMEDVAAFVEPTLDFLARRDPGAPSPSKDPS